MVRPAITFLYQLNESHTIQAAIVGGITILAYITMIGIRGDVARSEGNIGNNSTLAIPAECNG